MSVKVTCPRCQRRTPVEERLVGTLIECPECGDTFTAALVGREAKSEYPGDRRASALTRSAPSLVATAYRPSRRLLPRLFSLSSSRRARPSFFTWLSRFSIGGGRRSDGRPLNQHRLRSLLQRRVGDVVLADVDLLGPIDAVVFQLLQPVGKPPCYAGDGENRRE